MLCGEEFVAGKFSALCQFVQSTWRLTFVSPKDQQSPMQQPHNDDHFIDGAILPCFFHEGDRAVFRPAWEL